MPGYTRIHRLAQTVRAWWSPEARKEWHRKKTTIALMFEMSVDMAPGQLYVEGGVDLGESDRPTANGCESHRR